MRRIFTYLFTILIPFASRGQIGGSQGFSFVNIEPSALLAGLGGSTMASHGRDIGLAYFNPAMHTEKMHNRALLSYNNYIADINNGYAGYARKLGNGLASGHIIFNEYGTFIETDVTGKVLGEFRANDYIFQVSYGQVHPKDDRFTVGGSFKFLYSDYEKYIATAFAVDAAVAFNNPEKKFHASALIRNVGYNAIPYDNVRSPLPLDVQLGISKKLEHNPLKLTIVAHSLQRYDITYINTNTRNKNIDLSTGLVTYDEPSFGDKIMRHFNFGAELVFSENFQLRGGYNHQRRIELAPENTKGAAGFSWGVGIGIKKFTVDYAMVVYFPGITTSMFTVGKNLADFKRAKPENS